MLLRKIYDTHKEVSDAFDAFIWVTVSRFPILKLHGSIASEINLELAETDFGKIIKTNVSIQTPINIEIISFFNYI